MEILSLDKCVYGLQQPLGGLNKVYWRFNGSLYIYLTIFREIKN